MAADPNIKTTAHAFADWLCQQTREVSAADAERVAIELLELAGGGPVSEAHADELTSRYRRRMMGPRTIVTASRVGVELLAWQQQATPAAAQPPAISEARAPLPTPPRDLDLDALLGDADVDWQRLPDLGLAAPPDPPAAPPQEPRGSSPTHHAAMSDEQLNTYVDPVAGRDPFALSSPPPADAALELDFDSSDQPSAAPYVRDGEIEFGDDDDDVELNVERVTVGEELDVRDFGAIDEHDKTKKRR